ncbi:MAG: tetratricopeptide repeat protein [Steroidobacteraceae bacterium]|nr:tetratricopeptide repeat protein [Steroidobacteraceae bacterium]
MNRPTGSLGENTASFRVGDWVADPARDLLVRGDEQVKIEPRSMEVLRRLARQPGAVVSQAELEADVWAGVIVTSQSVYQAIAQLRRVLGDNPREPRYIETVPRRGYRLVTPVAPVVSEAPTTDDVPAQAVPEPDPTPAPAQPMRLRRPRIVFATIVGMLALMVVVGWAYWPQWQSRRGSSIAVLPFDDLSADRSQGYLANLLVDELTNALGQVQGLKVAARDSARTASLDGAAMTAIGKQLGVEHVLRGNVRRVGDRVRVVAVLVETDTGYEKWSRTFERPAASVARLPGDIAGAAAGAVGLALVGDPGVRGSRVGTRNPTAYDYYMLGQQRFSERTAFALTEAERYFQQAVEADPAFAAAYAALADVYVAEFYFANRQLTETLDLVLPLVDEALEIDPTFGLAHALLGWVEIERGDFGKAQVDLAKAVELSPNSAKARMWLGGALFADARPREALDELDRALELDPLNFILHIRRALALDALGRHDAAIEAATRAVTLAPRHPNPRWTLALIATSRGELQQAIAHFESALALDPSRSDLRIQLATLLLDTGRESDAHRQLSEAARLAQSSHAFLSAQAYLALLAGDQRELASIAESLASIDPRNRYLMMDAANFMALAGEHAKAIELFDRARAEYPDAVLNDLWMIRWGLETAPSCLARSYAATGRTDEHARLVAQVDRFLLAAQQRGVRYWGIAYQRAALAALQGDTSNALARLEEAAAAGWRRSWWARTDPALASLHSLPEFNLLLDRLQGSQR